MQVIEREALQDYWARYFKVYDNANGSIPYRELVTTSVELVGPVADKRVLDMGSGTGNISDELARHGAHVVGIDFCEPALEKCRTRVPTGEFRFADLTKTVDLPSESFDAGVCCNVIYLLTPEAQLNACRELFRLLKPGARATITVFRDGFSSGRVFVTSLKKEYQVGGAKQFAKALAEYGVGAAKMYGCARDLMRGEKDGRYTFFTREQLRDVVERAGFEIEEIRLVFADQCLMAVVRKPS